MFFKGDTVKTEEKEQKTDDNIPREKKWLTSSLLISICLLILAIPSLVIFYFYLVEKGQKDNTSNNTTESEASKQVDLPPKPKYTENPINGVPILETKKSEIERRLPLCVMIENLPDARPQYGLYDADMVYEAVAEGGITRFMAVFWSKDVEKIMPIRSARKYYVDWSTDIKDCIYYHIGEATSPDPDVGVRQTINRYGIKNIHDILFWRDKECDRVKNTEHCAYSSTKAIWDHAKELGWSGDIDNVRSYLFKHDKDPIISGVGIHDYSTSSHQIHVTLSRPYKTIAYHIIWVYDPKTNSYLRYHGVFDNKEPLVDPVSGKNISAKNIALIRTKIKFTGDIKNRNEVTVIGSGPAWILIDGKVVEGRWEKKDINSRTIFYDLEGNEFRFDRGQLWIQAIPDDIGIQIRKADNSEEELK